MRKYECVRRIIRERAMRIVKFDEKLKVNWKLTVSGYVYRVLALLKV
jgi:hypothetical protein